MLDYIAALLAVIGLTVLGTAGWAWLSMIDTGEIPGGSWMKLSARFGISLIVGVLTYVGLGIPTIYPLLESFKGTPTLAFLMVANGYWVLDIFQRFITNARIANESLSHS